MYKYLLYYNKILKILGLKKLTENCISNERTINILNEEEIKKLTNNDIIEPLKNKWKCIDIFYIFLSFLLISWRSIFIIYYAIKEENNMIIFKNLFDFSILFQYYYSYRYFQTDHFVEFIKKIYVMYPKKFNLYIIVYPILLIILSFIYSGLSIGLLFIENNTINNFILNYVKDYKTLFYILFFIENLFSISIYLLNAYIFSLVFVILSYDINEFYNGLKNNNIKYVPSELCNNMLRLRNNYEESVEYLNSIFSIIIFFGFTSTYLFIIDIDNILYIQIVHFIIFIKLYIIYFYSIVLTLKSKDKLQNFIYSNNIIEKLLTRKKINKSDINYEDMLIILDSENADTLDWFITYQIFKDDWDYFKFFGFVIEDINIFKKIFLLVISLYITNNFTDLFN